MTQSSGSTSCTDPALLALAKIVRVADGGSGREAEAAGLEAAAAGFQMLARDDLDNQRLQFPLYDALYAYCKWKVETGGQLEHTGSGPCSGRGLRQVDRATDEPPQGAPSRDRSGV